MKKVFFILHFVFGVLCFSFSQNVGIGTTTPEGLLHVKGTNWTKAILENNTGDPRGYFGIDNNGTITIGANAYWNGSAWVYPNTGSSLYMLFHRLNHRYEFRVRPDGGSQSTAMAIDTGSNVTIGGNLVIDQENGNTGTIGNTLRFGNLSGEGIGSKRNSGTGQWGLDFYTNSINRMTVANNGNVGIGVTNPLTKLEVNGSIKIGNSTINEAGSIRYNNNRFEGYTGNSWIGFEQVSTSSVITSRKANDASLLGQGYKYVGAIPGVITRDTISVSVTANTWLQASKNLNYPPPGLTGQSVAWTGSYLVVWGGADMHHENTDPQLPYVKTNAKCYYYDFNTDLWDTVINRQPEGRYLHSTVWTGTEMIIWGGRKSNTDGSFTSFGNGARLDASQLNPSYWGWTDIGGPSARYNHSAVWTGTEMIVWGGQSSNNITSVLNSGSRYNPATNTWTPISTVNAPSSRTEHTAVWVGGKMVVWGGKISSGFPSGSGGVYDPVTDTWSAISGTNAPFQGEGYAAITNAAGTSMLLWGGYEGSSGTFGHSYNVTTNTWSTYSPGNSITSRMYPSLIIANGNTIVFGGYDRPSQSLTNDAYRNNTAIPPPANTAAAASHLFWTGNFLIAYGGFSPIGPTERAGTNACTRLFLTPQSVTYIKETNRNLFLYQKN